VTLRCCHDSAACAHPSQSLPVSTCLLCSMSGVGMTAVGACEMASAVGALHGLRSLRYVVVTAL
jgi:hypothetical protein